LLPHYFAYRHAASLRKQVTYKHENNFGSICPAFSSRLALAHKLDEFTFSFTPGFSPVIDGRKRCVKPS